MRGIILVVACLSAWAAHAQSPRQSVRIQISYEQGTRHLEQAVAFIEAVNTIQASTAVDYQAGRSVSLLPGFEAQTGSTFSAFIKPVAAENETPLQLAAYPNPFEQTTLIEYYLPADGKVNLWIMDAQGKPIRQLVDAQDQKAGKYQIEWKAESVSAGIYVPVLESNQQRTSSRLVKK
ncbi:hypothetical protein GCM10027578_41060 [Spirosoma luteolum]